MLADQIRVRQGAILTQPIPVRLNRVNELSEFRVPEVRQVILLA